MRSLLTVAVCVALAGCTPKSRVMDALEPPAASSAPRATASPQRLEETRRWALRAAVAAERGDFSEAERALGWVRRLEVSGSPWSYVRMGQLFERMGRYDEAVAQYVEATERCGECDEAHLGLGRVMLGQGLPAGAAPPLRRAVELRPTSEAYELLGRALVLQELADEALDVLEAWRVDEQGHGPSVRQVRLAREVGCGSVPVVRELVEAWRTSTSLVPVAAAVLQDCGHEEEARTARASLQQGALP